MTYLIDYSTLAKRYIKKLDKHIRKILYKKINKLRESPENRGKHLRLNFYELKHNSYRIYYKVYTKVIIIEKIKYEGKVRIDRVGKKNTQKRDIKKL